MCRGNIKEHNFIRSLLIVKLGAFHWIAYVTQTDKINPFNNTSYMANTSDAYIAATCDYGTAITALVQNKNVFGAQFHPEKSGAVGLTILKNFGGLTR